MQNPETIVATPTRKRAVVDNADVIRLNALGLRMSTIAEKLGCSTITVTNRLKALGVPVVDTRRSFMDDVYAALEPAEQEWLADYLFVNEATSKDLVVQLIKSAFAEHGEGEAVEEVESVLDGEDETEVEEDSDEDLFAA